MAESLPEQKELMVKLVEYFLLLNDGCNGPFFEPARDMS